MMNALMKKAVVHIFCSMVIKVIHLWSKLQSFWPYCSWMREVRVLQSPELV